MCWKKYSFCHVQFSIAVITSYHKFSSLKQLNLLCHSSSDWRSGRGHFGLKSRCWQCCIPYWRLWGKNFTFRLIQVLAEFFFFVFCGCKTELSSLPGFQQMAGLCSQKLPILLMLAVSFQRPLTGAYLWASISEPATAHTSHTLNRSDFLSCYVISVLSISGQ